MLTSIRKGNKAFSVLFIYIMFASEFASLSYGIENMINHENSRSNDFGFSIFHADNSISKNANNLDKIVKQKRIEAETSNLTQSSASGPGQGENTGFSAQSTDGMVDKFTGDFSYSIPLMDVEGYPISISYNSNVSMDSEASWVGLGWDLSVGAVNRDMRGVPDEANGNDVIKRVFSQRDQKITDGKKNGGYIGASFSFKTYSPGLNVTILGGSYDDSYLGVGKTLDLALQARFGLNIANSNNEKIPFGFGGTFGFSKDTKKGVGINKGFSLSKGQLGNSNALNFGSSFQSRAGLANRSFSFSSDEIGGMSKGTVNGLIMSSPYGTPTSIPRVQFNSKSKSRQSIKDFFVGYQTVLNTPPENRAGYQNVKYSSSTEQHLDNSNQIYQPMFGYLHSGKRESFSETKYVLPVMDFERSNDQEFSKEMKNLPFSVQTYDFFNVSAMGVGGVFRAGRNDFGTYYDPTAVQTINEFNIEEDLPVDGDIPALLQTVVDELAESVNTIEFSAGAIYVGPAFPPAFIDGKVQIDMGRSTGDIESSDWTKPLNFNHVAQSDNFDPSTYFKAMGENTPRNMTAWNQLGAEAPISMNVAVTPNQVFLLPSAKTNSGTTVPVSAAAVNSSNGNEIPVTATVFEPKTAGQCNNAGDSQFKIYTQEANLFSTQDVNRTSSTRHGNHISKVGVISPSGGQYKFGIPVYNISTSEVSFSSGRTDLDPTQNTNVGPLPYENYGTTTLDYGVVKYQEGVDNSINNNRGRSQLYDKTTMPAFAHSFLLTEYLSSDYVDRSNDGPTTDDIGNYYKFNYTRIHDENNAFQWRYPVSGGNSISEGRAIQNRGLIGTELDDVASYTYGEKEVYYSHSIESKNFIAFFYLSDREDGYAVDSEKGNLSPDSQLKKLEKIELYNRSDYLSHLEGDPPLPLQTVYFEYDYSLCELAPSNKNSYSSNGIRYFSGTPNSGKLTLTKIRTQSGASEEMALSSYSFDYDGPNPDHSYIDRDPWGNTKTYNGALSNDINPYTDQTYNQANVGTSWKLTSIKNPSGGEVIVEYEGDTYGYVQNKRAMRHFKVHGLMNVFELLKAQHTGSTVSTSITNNFITSSFDQTAAENYFPSSAQAFMLMNNMLPYGGSNAFGEIKKDMLPNHVMVFKLESEIPSATSTNDANTLVQDEYFRDPSNTQGLIDEIFVKMMVEVRSGVYEYIPMAMPISSNRNSVFNNLSTYGDDIVAIGALPPLNTGGSGNYQYGYVVLETLNNGKKDTKLGKDKEGIMFNPLQHYALSYVRQNLPDIIYGSCTNCTVTADMASIDKKVAFGSEINKVMVEKNLIKSFFASKSRMRLYEADNIKTGGNGRVKRITYKDNWQAVSAEYQNGSLINPGEYNSSYVWDYHYALSGKENERGVAAFEPGGMMDECPFYNWETYTDIAKKFPDETKFNTTPLGRQLYPGPTIGYQKVEVVFNSGLDNGRSETVFHTAKDYPTIESPTLLNRNAETVSPKLTPLSAFFSRSHQKYGRSQGFTVETNNYHGKIESSALYSKEIGSITSVPISKTQYFYKPLGDPIKMMDRENGVVSEQTSCEYDIHSDSRFILEKSYVAMAGAKLRILWAVGTPAPVISVKPTIPKFQDNTSGFFTNTIIKHINRSVILDSVVTDYLGSVNRAEDLVYDYYTGDVIASSLTDEYKDQLYSFSFPSHWVENNLREVPTEKGISVSGQVITSGSNKKFVASTPSLLLDNFSEGDLVEIGSTTYQLYSVDNTGAILMKTDGDLNMTLSGNQTMNLIESNRKNRLSESIQSFVTKSPLSFNVGSQFTYPFDQIISSSAITYKRKNGFRCGTPVTGYLSNEITPGQIYNPFNHGLRGDLVLDGQFAFQNERKSAHSHGIRFDGAYENFAPYYEYSSGQGWQKSTNTNITHYRKMGETSHYDEFGNVVEVQDQIKIPSTVLYGYSSAYNALPVAQAVNATKEQIAYDGFEDYGINLGALYASETHFDFKTAIINGSNNVNVTKQERHSGLYSLEVPSGAAISVTKQAPFPCDPNSLPSNSQDPNTILNSCNCTPSFLPPTGDYVVSVWVKFDPNIAASNQPRLTISLSSSSYDFDPSGPVIDGWRKIEGNFFVGPSDNAITVALHGATDGNVFFDDIRIHPFLSGMTTVVYDERTFLPLASHDGYNFTTFYNYDENLNLVRVRVETIEGIKTISESEFGGQKDFKQ